MPQREILAADLFCGAGGFSTGLMKAAAAQGHTVRLIAINHWQAAIATHQKNHPEVQHLCESLESVNPRQLVPGGRLHLLMASPECMHHSNARGGRPMNDQSRASAWHILRWAEALAIDHLLIENVPEFLDWGPLGADSRPLLRKKGQLFQQFVRSLRILGYRIEWRVLNAADYGDPTTRKRLFIRAAKGSRAIVWPEASHTKPGNDGLGLLTDRPKWRAAREVIDWTVPGRSIFGRKRPLCPNTVRRIEAGLQKFCGLPFLISTCHKTHAARVFELSEPLRTVTGAGEYGLVQPELQPFLVGTGGPTWHGEPRSVEDPLHTVLARNHECLVEPQLTPFVVSCGGPEANPRSVEDPMRTVLAREGMGLAHPFLVPYYTEREGQAPRVCSLDEPLDTVTAEPRFGLAEPFLVSLRNHQDAKSLDEPLPTTTGGGSHAAVAEPFLVKYYGSSESASSVDEPLDTVTAKDRFALVRPLVKTADGQLYWLDVQFRMLQPHELARAMSFPDSYEFSGTRSEIIRQIGNAVPCSIAAALCSPILARGGGFG